MVPPNQDTGRWEFTAEAEQYLSFLFLQSFLEKYNALINAIGNYMAKYQVFHSHFLRDADRAEKMMTIAVIKANLSPVVFQLEAINKDLKNEEAREHLEALKRIHNQIVYEEDIPFETLQKMNEHLSKVVAILFLRPIMTKIPGRKGRIFGTVEMGEFEEV